MTHTPGDGLISYDTPIQVSLEAYNKIVRNYSGYVAHRHDNGNYFIKVWVMEAANQINNLIRKDFKPTTDDK